MQGDAAHVLGVCAGAQCAVRRAAHGDVGVDERSLEGVREVTRRRGAGEGAGGCEQLLLCAGGDDLAVADDDEVIADDLVVIGNGKIVASGSKEELLAAAGTLARSTSPRDLAHALEQAGIPSTLVGDGSVRTDADPARVGAVALTAGIALTELRSAEGTRLEDMFLSLTADTQREGVAA